MDIANIRRAVRSTRALPSKSTAFFLARQKVFGALCVAIRAVAGEPIILSIL